MFKLGYISEQENEGGKGSHTPLFLQEKKPEVGCRKKKKKNKKITQTQFLPSFVRDNACLKLIADITLNPTLKTYLLKLT